MAQRLSQMVLLKKVLIPDYRGLSVQKRCVFLLFFAFLHNGSKDLPDFLCECKVNMFHGLC